MSRKNRRHNRNKAPINITSLKYQFRGKQCIFTEPNTRLLLTGQCQDVIAMGRQAKCIITGVPGRGTAIYEIAYGKVRVVGVGGNHVDEPLT